MWLLNKIALFSFIFISSCGTLNYTVKRESIKHIYISPVTSRVSEDGIDLLFTKAADTVFYTDSRVKVDKIPIPDKTVIVKPIVTDISGFSVGYNKDDIAVEYRLTIDMRVKLFKYGYAKPFKTIELSGANFYSVSGTPEESEANRKKCIEETAEDMFRNLIEKLLQAEANDGA